jgi:hypothetical protein
MESWTYSTRSTTVHTTVHCSVGYRTCRPALCASFPPSNVNSSLGTVTRAVGRTNNQLVQSSGTVVAVYPHSYLGCFLSWVLWQARRLSSRAYPQCVELVSITDFLFFCFAASHSERRGRSGQRRTWVAGQRVGCIHLLRPAAMQGSILVAMRTVQCEAPPWTSGRFLQVPAVERAGLGYFSPS